MSVQLCSNLFEEAYDIGQTIAHQIYDVHTNTLPEDKLQSCIKLQEIENTDIHPHVHFALEGEGVLFPTW